MPNGGDGDDEEGSQLPPLAVSTPDTSLVAPEGDMGPQTPLSTVSSVLDESLETPSGSPKHKFQPPSFRREGFRSRDSVGSHAPSIMTKRNTNPLFRRRSSVQTLTKAQKDALYDSTLDDSVEGNTTGLYNVPIASHSSLGIFHSSLGHGLCGPPGAHSTPDLLIPPSPLPGTQSSFVDSPALKSSPSLAMLSPEARQLSVFYEAKVQSLAAEELQRRKQAAPKLNASFDDLDMASDQKAALVTITRPTWCPPKPQQEKKAHERAYQKMLEHGSRVALRESRAREHRNAARLVGDERLGYLTTKTELSQKNIGEVRKYIGGSRVTPATKAKLLDLCFKGNTNNIQKYIGTQDDFKTNKSHIAPYWEIYEEALTTDGYTSKQAKKILLLFEQTIPTLPATLKPLLHSRSLAYILRNFQDDLNIISTDTLLALLAKVPPHILSRAIETLLSSFCVSPTKMAKRFIAIASCILRDHHFGWTTLQLLLITPELDVYIGTDERAVLSFWEATDALYTRL